MLVLPRPLGRNRSSPQGACQKRGVQGNVVGAVVSLLRADAACVPVATLCEGRFQTIIPDYEVDDARVILLCTGKIAYDLMAFRDKHRIEKAAVIRLEQLYPFPFEDILTVLDRYPDAKDLRWVQEEPMNMGGWNFIAPRLGKLIRGHLRYAGRDEASSTASGSKAVHHGEQKALVEEAFEV